MLYYVVIFLLSVTFLFFLNEIQKRFNFCLDKVTNKELHKKLLESEKNVPLSGSFFFILPIIIIFFKFNATITLVCVIFFFIGLLSDLKILHSPKYRFLLQYLVLILLLFFNKELNIDTRIEFFNYIINHSIARIFLISFFFLVLINGFNFVDGVNNLSSVNFLIVLFFIHLSLEDIGLLELNKKLSIILTMVTVFIIFNFFGKCFLGDGAVYGLGFLIGFLSIYASSLSDNISPYFYANLLWYPAFENLFSIVRRIFSNKKNYLADNDHFHHLLFQKLVKKFYLKKKFIISSLTGIIINAYLSIFYIIGYLYASKTNIQLTIIFLNIFVYFLSYLYLRKIKY